MNERIKAMLDSLPTDGWHFCGGLIRRGNREFCPLAQWTGEGCHYAVAAFQDGLTKEDVRLVMNAADHFEMEPESEEIRQYILERFGLREKNLPAD